MSPSPPSATGHVELPLLRLLQLKSLTSFPLHCKTRFVLISVWARIIACLGCTRLIEHDRCRLRVPAVTWRLQHALGVRLLFLNAPVERTTVHCSHVSSVGR